MEQKRTWGISIWFLAVLCGAGLFAIQSIFFTSHVFRALLWGVGAFFLTHIAWIDYRQKRIPNRWLLFLFLGQTLCITADVMHLDYQVAIPDYSMRLYLTGLLAEGQLFMRFLGMLVPLILFFLLHRIHPGGIGAGDEKLFLLLGFTMGFESVLRVMLISMLLFLVIGFCVCIRQKVSFHTEFSMGPAIWAAFLLAGCTP